MIRAFVSVLVLTFASAAFADQNCENLVLTCTAVYRAYDDVAEVDTSAVYFADQNTYEPSLKNCAAQVYLPTRGTTTIGVYADKDLQTGVISYTAQAIQLVETPEGRGAKNSEIVRASASVGFSQPLGYVALPEKISIGSAYADSAHVRCTTSEAK